MARILFLIKPDLIFEELDQLSFTEIYEGRRSDTLETLAVKMYSSEHIVKHHPVDIDGNLLVDKQLKNSIIKMSEIFQNAVKYRTLTSTLTNYSNEFGFPFLNSIACEEILADKYFLEQKLSEEHGQADLVKVHQRWIRINDVREREMVKNISDYSERNDFSNAVFLVGVEHRKPVIDLIRSKENEKSSVINWNFQYLNLSNKLL